MTDCRKCSFNDLCAGFSDCPKLLQAELARLRRVEEAARRLCGCDSLEQWMWDELRAALEAKP